MKFRSSIVAIALFSSIGFAGGDIGGVTDFQNTDYIEAEREANNIIEEATPTTVEDFTTTTTTVDEVPIATPVSTPAPVQTPDINSSTKKGYIIKR